MPRLKPPPSAAFSMPEDTAPPTEPVEIELAGDEPSNVEVDLAPPAEKKPVDDNPLQKALDAQSRAEDLQRTAQRERDEALRHARERDTELAKERGSREDAEYNSVLTAIAAEQAALDKAESDYAQLARAGDFETAAKAQRIMAIASARLDRLEEGKQAFEQRRDAPKPEPKEPVRDAAPLDFEQQIAKMPESAKSWLRKHPEFISDPALNKKIGSVHNYLVDSRGVAAFTDDYFDALDGEFGFKAAPAEPDRQPQRRSMPVSAPVSRDVPTASGQRPSSTKMTLSQEERLIARSAFSASDMTNEQKELLYAQNKRKLQTMRANGQYPQQERN